MPAVPSPRIHPLTVRSWDDDLHATRVHGIGFGVTCECGERSPVCASYAMARGWLREHTTSTHRKGTE